MDTNTHPSPKTTLHPVSQPWRNTLKRVASYLFVRLLTISVTIFLGVFLTILVVNRSGAIDNAVKNQIEEEFARIQHSEYGESLRFLELEALQHQMLKDAGLSLPYPIRALRYTADALMLKWGSVKETLLTEDEEDTLPTSLTSTSGGYADRFDVKHIIAEKFPNTLLLIGTANLLVFLVGIPLALYLLRRPGNWLDRLLISLLPISSIPSWVHGILLMIVFAWSLHLLPSGRMVDSPPPGTSLGYMLSVLKHMILPVTALLLNQFLQCASTWRTYFLMNSSEDYVEYALAKGLTPRQVEKRYILRPTLPYIITSFALSLVGFWQIITALEYFFQWPGIGFLYVESLKISDMLIVIALVVVFAYLLGFIVLLLDIVYVLVDPRIQLRKKQTSEQSAVLQEGKLLTSAGRRLYLKQMRREQRQRLVTFFTGLVKRPLKMFGILFSFLLLILSLNLPRLAKIYIQEREQDFIYQSEMNFRQESIYVHAIPVNAAPLWTNWFRSNKLPSTIILDSHDESFEKTVSQELGFEKVITITYTFDYPYNVVPQNAELIFDMSEEIWSAPLVSMTWILPDGTSVQLKYRSGLDRFVYSLPSNIPRTFLDTHAVHNSLMLSNNENVEESGSYDPLITLFTDPTKAEPVVIPGKYTLVVKCYLENVTDDFDAQFVLTGQAYGPTGSNNQHNDTLAPFFNDNLRVWGTSVAGSVTAASMIVLLIWGKKPKRRVKYPQHSLSGKKVLTMREKLARSGREMGRRWKKFWAFFRELAQYPSAIIGLTILIILLGISFSQSWLTSSYYQQRDADLVWKTEMELNAAKIQLHTVPKNAAPLWLNWMGAQKPPSIILDGRTGNVEQVEIPGEGFPRLVSLTYTFDYPYRDVPQDVALVFYLPSIPNAPFATVTWITPDGREIALDGHRLGYSKVTYVLSDYIPRSYLQSHALYDDLEEMNSFNTGGEGGYGAFVTLFTDPTKDEPVVIQGTYTLRVDCYIFDENTNPNAMLVITGQTYGLAGTDNQRNDLLEPLLQGAPTVMAIGLLGSLVTTLVSLAVAALSTWFGSWVDELIQRITESIMILPMLAIGVLLNQLFGASLWTVMIIFVLLNAFGSPVKLYRSAMLQIREAPYIEAARAYGVNDWQIILRYMVPRVAPVLISQIVVLVPSYIFLEALMAVFGISGFSSWGEMLYLGLRSSGFQGNYSWFLQPFIFMTLISLGFALLGSALDKILNPRLKSS